MATTRTYSRAFNGGEVSPEFYGRLDDAKYQSGLALCENFIPLPHGPIHNRAGTEFVRPVKFENRSTRLLRFTFNIEQTMVLEFGHQYFRFHTNGATVISGTTPYELAHPYTEAQLFDVAYVQSEDVVTLVHPDHPVRELRRLGATNWQLVTVSFGTQTPAPSAVTATATVPPGTENIRAYRYLVTAVRANQESGLPPFATTSNNLNAAGTFNTVTWTPPSTAVEGYRVYRQHSGVWAFIGEVPYGTNTLQDEGIQPDVTKTPAINKNPFNGAGNFPSAVTYFEQRKVFAATKNSPQAMWFTRTGTESNMSSSLPLQADDAMTFKLAAREANAIRHLVPLQDLMVLTQSNEWRVAEDIKPTSIMAKPQSAVGASKVETQLVNSVLLFGSAMGGHVRAIGFSEEAGGYTTHDISLRATHLFDDYTLIDSALSKAPVPVVWYVSSSGKLLGTTYIPEQNINAWHQHTTVGGNFESVTTVTEGEEDAVYVIVRRTINGQQRRYVERMSSRHVRMSSAADGFFVDAGVRYDGPPINSTSSGLAHLEGQEVQILVDGAVQPPAIVSSGSVSWPKAGSKVVIGLPILAVVQTLPLALEIQGFGQGRPKNVTEAWMRLFESRSIKVGPSMSKLTELKPRHNENLGAPPDLVTGEASIKPSAQRTDSGSMFFVHDEPLPITVLSLTLEVDIAG